jgi:hypothetical protein
MSQNCQDASVGKPPHIENGEKLATKLRAQHTKANAELEMQAKKQARQHEGLNRLADAGNRK